MIVTVTPSPSLDLTYVVDALTDSEVHRARSATLEASGKGVNVSRALASAGAATVAVLPVGGATGRQLVELLEDDDVPCRAVPVGGTTRLNTTVLEPGRTLKVNAPAPPLTRAEAELLVAACADALSAGSAGDGTETWLVLCGSLPAGAAPGLVAALVRTARAAGARVAVDTSGAALAEALRCRVDLLSPNVAELAEVDDGFRAAVGSGGQDAVAAAASGFAVRTGTALLLSAGAAGATWTDGAQLARAVPPAVAPVNTAGAGDALLAGFLLAPGRAAERLARAVSWGTATCLAPTTVRPDVATAATGHPPTVTQHPAPTDPSHVLHH
ncbi:MAG: 1-phosphofructokinase family hexose kinase [Actinomycetes bacterium]